MTLACTLILFFFIQSDENSDCFGNLFQLTLKVEIAIYCCVSADFFTKLLQTNVSGVVHYQPYDFCLNWLSRQERDLLFCIKPYIMITCPCY